MKITQEHKEKAKEIKLMLKGLPPEVIHLLADSICLDGDEESYSDLYELVDSWGDIDPEIGEISVCPCIYLPRLTYEAIINEEDNNEVEILYIKF